MGETPEWWENTLNSIQSSEARAQIEKKRDMIISWLKNEFSIDVYKWRDTYQDRLNRLDEIDWDNLED